jgi:hypothetical protein
MPFSVYGNGVQAVLMIYGTALGVTLTAYRSGIYPFIAMGVISSSKN